MVEWLELSTRILSESFPTNTKQAPVHLVVACVVWLDTNLWVSRVLKGGRCGLGSGHERLWV